MLKRRTKSQCDFCGKDLREEEKIYRFKGNLNFCSEECHSYYRQRK